MEPPSSHKHVGDVFLPSTFSSCPDSSTLLLPTTIPTVSNDVKMTPDQEFQLAMRLFSDDPLVMQQELQQQLNQVQESLSLFSTSSDRYEACVDDTMVEMTTVDLSSQAKDMRCKIEFLSYCNEAKIAIDSSCPSYYRYGIMEEGSSWWSSDNAQSSWLIHCAERLEVARDALKKAKNVYRKQEEGGMGGKSKFDDDDDDAAIGDNHHDESYGGMSESDKRVAESVLKSIESQWSMRALNVCYDAIQIVEECVEVKENGIEVFMGMISNGKTGKDDSVVGHGETHGNGDEEEYKESIPNMSEPEENIKTAMKALAMLSFDKDSTYDKLEQVVLELAERILSIVIRPVIEAVREGLEEKESVSVEYDLVESTVEKTSRLGLHGQGFGVGHVGSKAGNKKKRATVKVLEWTARRTCGVGTREIMTIGKEAGEYHGRDALTWWTSLVQLIQRVIQFVCDNVFDQVEDFAVREEIYSIFGKAVFGNVSRSKNLHSLSLDFDIAEYGTKCPIVKMLGRLAWDHCVPSEVDKETLDALERCSHVLKDSISSFDSFLMDRHLSDQHTALSQYVDNFNQIYCDKVRMHVLAKGRKILLEGDYHNSRKVGVNLYEKKKRDTPEYLDQLGIEKQDMSIFIFEECGISQVASELMDLSMQTMDLAVDELTASHRLLPPTLYRATRELFDLYHAIIPTVHSSEIETIPRIAAVFHNDCCYFAHKLLTFGLEYRDRFPSDAQKESGLKQLCNFLDLVPIFREIAERTMNDIVAHQKVQILEIVNSRLEYFKDALGSNEGVVEWTDAETALTAGLYHLRHLSRAWKPVLARQVYLISMGSIVDNFLSLFLDKVLTAKDISVQACQFVSSLFQSGLRGVVEVFGSPSDPSEGAKDAEKSCSLYNKCAAVEKFMNMGIADINMALPQGIFRSMTGAELSRLVVAVFEDTDGRRKLLRVLESN